MDENVAKRDKRVCVVALGDIGRSPRMQYHSMSLAIEGFQVDIVAYGGSTPSQRLTCNDNVALHLMSDPPESIKCLPRIFAYGVKAIWQFMVLLITMLSLQKPSHVLMQNPPALPTLAVVWCYCILKSSKMIIDWHNYGFTVMSLATGPRHPLVKFAKWFEVFFGKKAHGNLCVTRAMQCDLEKNWGIRATVLHDRPPDMFRPLSTEEKHDIFNKLAADYTCFCSKDLPNGTAFTKETANGIEYRKVRPALLVSSTSWTEDEDFAILLEALHAYETSLHNASRSDLPRIVCAITGKGPMKAHYMELIARKEFQQVQFCTPWLMAEDYPKLLASADLGVCLHTSSSGLDLPMKVVDMFGCGLPVLAYDFKCLSELVVHGENGLVFREPTELKLHLQTLLAGFPENCAVLRRFASNLSRFRELTWHDNWKANAMATFTN